MSSYDDPRWYEQEPAQHHTNAPSPNGQESDDIPTSIFNTHEPDHNQSTPPQLPQPPQLQGPQLPPRQAPEPEPRIHSIIRQIIILTAIVVIAFLAGWFSHQLFTNNFNASTPSRSYLSLFDQAWNTVDQNYVDRKAVNYQQMSYQAIQAMLGVLHDTGHTRFLTPSDVQSENQSLSGTFTGIGIYLSQDAKTKQVIITATVPGAPAEKVGFKRGDVITAVNGTNVVGKDIPTISKLIQGPVNTSVSITILRPSTNKSLTIKVTRAVINVPNVIMHYIAQDHVADIQIVQFSDGVSSQLKDALTQAKQEGATKIILDLRDDPGGYLSEAINTASEFIPHGNVLLEQDSTGQRTPVAVTGNTVNTTSPLVVLVNNNTASAAEIVSGALQDNRRAIIMGVKTFGTGTVLQEYPLSDGSAILLGTQEWLTPNGHFIRNLGITPNITVKSGSNNVEITPNEENQSNMSEQQILNSGDTQLNAAIHYLEAR
ncbi:MAG: S41 family peptidase [Ktedonobacteraceae bacterium]